MLSVKFNKIYEYLHIVYKYILIKIKFALLADNSEGRMEN